MNYAIPHAGKVYGPDGLIKDVEGTRLKAEDVEEYNKACEKSEIEWLKTGPEKVTLYVKTVDDTQASMDAFVRGGWNRENLDPKNFKSHHYALATWLGTEIDPRIRMGPKACNHLWQAVPRLVYGI